MLYKHIASLLSLVNSPSVRNWYKHILHPACIQKQPGAYFPGAYLQMIMDPDTKKSASSAEETLVFFTCITRDSLWRSSLQEIPVYRSSHKKA